MHLNSEEMINVGEVFVNTFNHTLNNYITETKSKLVLLSCQLVLNYKTYLTGSPENIVQLVDLIFRDETHRDFILTLTAGFFSRWSGDVGAYRALVANLVAGTGYDHDQEPYGHDRITSIQAEPSLIPNEIRERLGDAKSVSRLLLNNKWLVTIILMQLFVSIDLTDEQKLNTKVVIKK